MGAAPGHSPSSDAVGRLIADLVDEHSALDDLVAELDEVAWRTPTPASGWDVADSVSHLYFFDVRAVLALVDPQGFVADTQAMVADLQAGKGDPSVVHGRSVSGSRLLADWRERSAMLASAARTTEKSSRVPWYGPSMSVASFLTARLMETWAHGVDIADALGRPLVITARLEHICHLGFLARGNSYRSRGLVTPDIDIALRLVAPDGSLWSWGSNDAVQRIEGDAVDFALLVTQRRHVDDTTLVARGAGASEWMSFAQAFAGPPGPGRTPLSR